MSERDYAWFRRRTSHLTQIDDDILTELETIVLAWARGLADPLPQEINVWETYMGKIYGTMRPKEDVAIDIINTSRLLRKLVPQERLDSITFRRPEEEITADIVNANELLVMLLSQITFTQLLRLRAVSHHFHILIDGTPSLQRKLHRLANFDTDPHIKFTMLPSGNPNIILLDNGDFEFKYGEQKPPQYIRDMFICQPPTTCLFRENRCHDLYEKWMITCPTGITIGHLVDIMNDTLTPHNCIKRCSKSTCRKGCYWEAKCKGKATFERPQRMSRLGATVQGREPCTLELQKYSGYRLRSFGRQGTARYDLRAPVI